MKLDDALTLLGSFEIETPSWGYADTGTRFGKFFQPGAAATVDEKVADAATVHEFSGCAPKMAVHALWDFGSGEGAVQRARGVQEQALALGISVGAINPNLFEDQVYKFGSACNSVSAAREMADAHVLECLEIGREIGVRDVSLWFADGTNFPGQDDIRARKRRMEEALKRWHGAATEGQRLLVEYKPFEPAFYHTDIADWGMALHFARAAGPRAKVLVDTGHHLPGANIEHIVAFLLDEGMLGGFHFNDRKYADDDLTLGSIDPYAVFRIFHEIANAVEEERVSLSSISFCVDQSHNLKPKVEAMLQTAVTAQSLFFKALLVDRATLREFQARHDIVGAERVLLDAFETDVRGPLGEFRRARGLAAEPLGAYRSSGHLARIESERGERNLASRAKSSYA
jgi:L-rhamnose isomerase/sugar isomerase